MTTPMTTGLGALLQHRRQRRSEPLRGKLITKKLKSLKTVSGHCLIAMYRLIWQWLKPRGLLPTSRTRMRWRRSESTPNWWHGTSPSWCVVQGRVGSTHCTTPSGRSGTEGSMSRQFGSANMLHSERLIQIWNIFWTTITKAALPKDWLCVMDYYSTPVENLASLYRIKLSTQSVKKNSPIINRIGSSKVTFVTILLRDRWDCLTKPSDIMHLTKNLNRHFIF